MRNILLLSIFFVAVSLPSYAQFIGIKIGIPNGSVNGVMAGSLLPNNYMTFNGQVMLFNGRIMTFTHS